MNLVDYSRKLLISSSVGNPLSKKTDYLKTIEAAKKAKAGSNTYYYSNMGYALLGQALSEATSSSYHELLSQLLEDLGLKNTKIGYDSERLHGYDKRGHDCGVWNWVKGDVMAASAGLTSTLDDMLEYVKLNLNSTLPEIKMCHIAHSNTKKFRMGLGWEIHSDEILQKSGDTGCFTAYVGFCKAKKVGTVILCNSTILNLPQLGKEFLYTLI